ncbi:cytochrome B561 [Magnetococcus marinus MC-1]|uniref:Cytochrome B561 n=1 Tax=Magnetococcus marinus (strain ATCC BAA-1437 / JCM 17883 / MC-1) TaxID=156889 RepID=A0LB43_MAGMM|nr:cytochrome b/b6 domain-containing protein [Magnetococcus marinus]ABK45186.1 cytochrome B561 [Magnetococcus marinus MC-1]
MSQPYIKVWDLPTRLFHWSLVAVVAGSFYTVKTSQMALHAYLGYGVLTLVLWRLGWGLWGSSTSRFSQFVRGPRVVLAYLRSLLAGQPHGHYGHNPAGAMMIVALLLVLLLQGLGGLFASENTFLFFDGPLVHWVGAAWSETLTFWHKSSGSLLMVLVGLHVLANLLYLLLFRQNLVRPMLTGLRPPMPSGETGATPQAPLGRALVTLLIAGALVVGLLQF